MPRVSPLRNREAITPIIVTDEVQERRNNQEALAKIDISIPKLRKILADIQVNEKVDEIPLLYLLVVMKEAQVSGN